MKKSGLTLCVTTVLLLSVVSFASAADLSEGVKGLKLRISKEVALKTLLDQESKPRVSYFPKCTKERLGEVCETYLPDGLTYGGISILKWYIVIGHSKNLERVELFLEKSGCAAGSQAIHPRLQFEKLSDLLESHYGKPNRSGGNSVVWLDRKLGAGLVLKLYNENLSGIGYPECPTTAISLTTDEFIKEMTRSTLEGSAKEKDI